MIRRLSNEFLGTSVGRSIITNQNCAVLANGESGLIYPIPGWDYYGLIHESICVLESMTAEDVANASGTKSVRYGEILRSELLDDLQKELSMRRIESEMSPGIHVLDDDFFIVVGTPGKVRKSPSRKTVLRQSLPISGMGAHKVGNEATYVDLSKTRRVIGARGGIPLRRLASTNHFGKKTMIFILNKEATRHAVEISKACLQRGVRGMAHGLGIDKCYVAFSSKGETVIADALDYPLIEEKVFITSVLGGEQLDSCRDHEVIMEVLARMPDLVNGHSSPGIAYIAFGSPGDADTGELYRALHAASKASDRLVFLTSLSLSPNFGMLEIANGFDSEYGINTTLRDASYIKLRAWRGLNAFMSNYRELRRVFPGHEITGSLYRAYYSTDGAVTVRQISETLAVPRHRILYNYKGNSSPSLPIFLILYGGLCMVTVPICDISGKPYRPAYDGSQTIPQNEIFFTLKYDPMALLAGPSFDRRWIM